MQHSTVLSEQVRDEWAGAAGGADEKLPVFRGHRARQHRAMSYEARECVVLKGRILDGNASQGENRSSRYEQRRRQKTENGTRSELRCREGEGEMEERTISQDVQKRTE